MKILLSNTYFSRLHLHISHIVGQIKKTLFLLLHSTLIAIIMTMLVLVITTIRISGENFGEKSQYDLDFGDDDNDRKKFYYCPKRAVNAQLAQAKGDSEALNPTRLKGIHRKH